MLFLAFQGRVQPRSGKAGANARAPSASVAKLRALNAQPAAWQVRALSLEHVFTRAGPVLADADLISTVPTGMMRSLEVAWALNASLPDEPRPPAET